MNIWFLYAVDIQLHVLILYTYIYTLQNFFCQKNATDFFFFFFFFLPTVLTET